MLRIGSWASASASRWPSLVLALAPALAGCGPTSSSQPSDAGQDAEADAGADSGADAGADAGADSGANVGSDAGHDSGVSGVDSGGVAPSDAGAEGSAPPTQCTWTASGAESASGTCTAGVAYGASSGQLAMSITNAGGTFTFSAQLGTMPTLAAGTWTYAQVPVAGGAFVVIPEAWDMSKGNKAGATPQGDFTLTLTQPGPEDMLDGGDLWPAPQGTLDVSMPADTASGATGTVTVQVTF